MFFFFGLNCGELECVTGFIMKILWSFVVLVALLYKLIAIQTVSISITTSTTFILLFLFFIFIKHLSYLIYSQSCIKSLLHRLISHSQKID